MLQLAPSSHVQHPHAAHQSHGSIPRSRCRIEFSHEYDTLCSCRTEEWPSIRKVYIKKIKKTSKSKAEVDLVYGTTSHIYSSSGFFWYTQNWFMFIQLFYCNCLSVQIGLWMNDRIFWRIFLNEWLAFKCLQSQKSTKTLCWAGKCRVLIDIINTFCCFHQTKNGFPLLNSTWRTYKKVPFRVQTKTERVSIRKRNAELCV